MVVRSNFDWKRPKRARAEIRLLAGMSIHLCYCCLPIEVGALWCCWCVLDKSSGHIAAGKQSSTRACCACCVMHAVKYLWTQITLYAEFFLVIDFLPIFKYSENRKKWSSGLVLRVWVPENFISHKTDTVDIWSSHIGNEATFITSLLSFFFVFLSFQSKFDWTTKLYVDPTVLLNVKNMLCTLTMKDRFYKISYFVRKMSVKSSTSAGMLK